MISKINERRYTTYIRGFITPKFSSGTSTVIPSTKKSVDEVAKEVLAGAWGNGDARKNALTAAGYNYSEVQAAVNRLAGGKTTTPTKSITEVAKEVLAGKWGNGDNRKKKLEAAGYNYSQVQAKVNELAKGSTSSKKSVTQIAKEVIAGKWGNGSLVDDVVPHEGTWIEISTQRDSWRLKGSFPTWERELK